MTKGRSILVTGGSGSFGNAFAKRLMSDPELTPARLVIYSRGEHAQETMARSLGAWSAGHPVLRFFIGDVRDQARLELAMRGIDTVIHAAALKVIPICDYNPTECIATNVNGAQNVVMAALRSGVKRVVALSTDKACDSTTLYGASKAAAEKIFLTANTLSAGECDFCLVRYGNVHGSRGSVVPLFQKLAQEGKPLPITDEKMTRFWIKMDQAVDLVLEALAAPAKSILIPRIPSMRVVDLADAIDPGGKREIVGIRPTEKVHECLMTEDEAAVSYPSGNGFVVSPNATLRNAHFPVGFRYTSDTNDQWLTVEQLRAIL